MVSAGTTQAGPNTMGPRFSEAVAFDVSQPLSILAQQPVSRTLPPATGKDTDSEPAFVVDTKSLFSSLAGLLAPQAAGAPTAGIPGPPATIPATSANFEGLSNQDNFNIFGGRVNPPDTDGDVGPNHYVEMINLVVGVFSKTGTLLAGPASIGTLWAGFPITDCTNPAGDPIVVHDQKADRWILSQFTTQGPTYYECVAVSQTADPTGAYYRYAFSTGPNFPDYPKLGVWRDSYILTTREFGPTVDRTGSASMPSSAAGCSPARRHGWRASSSTATTRRSCRSSGDGLLPPDLDGKPDSGSARSLHPSSGRRTTTRTTEDDVRRAQHLGPASQVEARP